MFNAQPTGTVNRNTGQLLVSRTGQLLVRRTALLTEQVCYWLPEKIG